MHDGQVQAAVVVVVVIAARWHMVGFHHLVALQGFQVNVEPPQPMQVLEYLFGGFAQGFAVVLLVTQCQLAVAAHIDAVDLHVGLAVSEVVLRRQGFTDGAVAGFIVNGRHHQIILEVVVHDAEQLEVANHLG